MDYLRNYANSNRETEPRVYQELKEYNYWRNLYRCKWIALMVYMGITIREINNNDSFSFKEIFTSPYSEYIAFLMMIMGLLGMCFLVNRCIVKGKLLIMRRIYLKSAKDYNDDK